MFVNVKWFSTTASKLICHMEACGCGGWEVFRNSLQPNKSYRIKNEKSSELPTLHNDLSTGIHFAKFWPKTVTYFAVHGFLSHFISREISRNDVNVNDFPPKIPLNIECARFISFGYLLYLGAILELLPHIEPLLYCLVARVNNTQKPPIMCLDPPSLPLHDRHRNFNCDLCTRVDCCDCCAHATHSIR